MELRYEELGSIVEEINRLNKVTEKSTIEGGLLKVNRDKRRLIAPEKDRLHRLTNFMEFVEEPCRGYA